MIIGVANRDLGFAGVDRCIHFAFERRSLFGDMIVQQVKRTMLREDSGLVECGAVFKFEPHVAGYVVAFWYLRGFAIGDGLAIRRTENEKTVGYAFCVADTDTIRLEC